MRTRQALLPAALLLLISGRAPAAFEELEIGVAAQAMGGTGVVLEGAGHVLFNPAAIAGGSGRSVVAAGRLPYWNMDFATFGLDGELPVSRRWNAGMSIRHFGGELYSEQMLALTFAGALTDDMSFGIQPVACRVSMADGVSEYGSASAFAVNAGFQVRVYTRWMLAASLRNPFQARIGGSGEYMGRRVDAGLRYEPAAGMLSALAFSRDFHGTRIHAGQALPLGPLTLMAGVQSSPVTVSGGLDASLAGIVFSYAVTSHPKLHPTHQFGVQYAF